MGKQMTQQIDTRIHGYLFGVDFSSDARVLAISENARLVWQSGFQHYLGIGHGHKRVPASLVIRTFAWQDDRPRFVSAITLAEGGRLTKQRLLALREAIDGRFGIGAAEQLEPCGTRVFGEDGIGAWVAAKQAEAPYVSPTTRALMAGLDALTGTRTFDGMLL